MTPELVTDTSKSPPCSNGTKLSLSERTLLSFHEAYRYTCNTLSTALGISRISKVTISSSEPVCLLAKMYPDAASDSTNINNEQDAITAALSQFEQDLSERLWFSYRTGFTPLGEDQLTGDAGWGCTLRSCQMLLAQALLMHLLGRSQHTAAPERITTRKRVVSRFHDSPEPCFSIHSICAAGAKYGLVPGRWMGPYALCRAVADIAADRCPDSLQVTVIESGGGAPCIDPDKLKQSFEHPVCEAASQGSPHGSDAPQGLLALVPVVLGVERLNSVYAQQLQAILRWPHSVGIVGGRPGHSYYFMGFQGDRLICMDPHVMQATDGEPGATATHRPLGVQSVPIAAIDSTMALGFYCRSAADVDRLAEAVQELADSCSRSPLLSLGSLPDVQDHDCDCSWDSEEDQAEGERGVLVGSMPRVVSGDLGNDDVGTNDHTTHAVQATPDRAHAIGDTPSSPVLVSGSLSSAELASTGVGGWEIVDSCG